MAPSGQHLQLFNPKPTTEGTFYPFPRLPIEIRCMIWEQELHHERFICVDLASHEAQTEHVRRGAPWAQSDVTQNYLVTSAWPAINKVFHISAESRSYASRFYRVQLPCRYVREGRVEEKGIFYFNPELDTLEVRGMHHFVKFAHDLWRYDPRKAGLLRAVMDVTFFRRKFITLFNDVEDKALLREVFSRLKHVAFMDHGSKGRMYLDKFFDDRKFEFHRSRPIMAAASRFQRLPDPRPIQADLKRLDIGISDPRRLIRFWLRMMASLDVQTEFKYRFMITYGEARDQIYSRDDAVRYIQEEDLEWRRESERRRARSQTSERLPMVPEETDQELDQAPQPAIGFWLFPIEILGRGTFARNIDVSEYTPELCLFNLT